MPRKGEYQDLTGMRFNRLTVIKLQERTDRRRYMWLCKCDCGKEIVVSADHLKNNHTRSCGCWSKDRIQNLNYKTGLSNTKLHYAYHNMCNRCMRKNNYEYKYYGGRGISICDEWLGENGFLNFSNWAISNGYEEGLQIDRIDNNKSYSPDNCRWTSRIQQANNKRNNVYVNVNGEIDTVANMARKHNLNYWNLLHYSKGGKNCMYPHLRIEVVQNE